MSDAGTYTIVYFGDGTSVDIDPAGQADIETAMRDYVVQRFDTLLVAHAMSGARLLFPARLVSATQLSTPATREAQRAHARAVDAEAKAEWHPGE